MPLEHRKPFLGGSKISARLPQRFFIFRNSSSSEKKKWVARMIAYSATAKNDDNQLRLQMNKKTFTSFKRTLPLCGGRVGLTRESNSQCIHCHFQQSTYIQLTKGSFRPPEKIFFWKNPTFGESQSPKIHWKNCNIIFWIENDHPPPPLIKISKKKHLFW